MDKKVKANKNGKAKPGAKPETTPDTPKGFRITLTAGALADALGHVVGVVTENRQTLPVLACVALEATADRVRLYGSNLEQALEVSIRASVGGSGGLVVNASTLHQLTRALDRDTTLTIVDEQENGALVTTPHSTWRLPTLTPEEMPPMPDAVAGLTLWVDAEAFTAGLKRTAYAVSTDATRPFLCGLNVLRQEARLRLGATDGHRLALATVPLHQSPEPDPLPVIDFIIPSEAIKPLRHLLRGAAGRVALAYASATPENGHPTAGTLSVAAGAARLVTKLVDGVYPKLEQVIPSGAALQWVSLNTEEVKAACAQLKPIGKFARWTFGPDGLTVVASADGETRVVIPAAWGHEPITIGLCTGYVEDIVHSLPGLSAQWGFSTPLAPACVKVESEDGPAAVVMPAKP